MFTLCLISLIYTVGWNLTPNTKSPPRSSGVRANSPRGRVKLYESLLSANTEKSHYTNTLKELSCPGYNSTYSKITSMAKDVTLPLWYFSSRTNISVLQDSKRDERKKLADEEAMRKIKQLEDQTHQLQRQVATHKQVRLGSTIVRSHFKVFGNCWAGSEKPKQSTIFLSEKVEIYILFMFGALGPGGRNFAEGFIIGCSGRQPQEMYCYLKPREKAQKSSLSSGL